MLVTLSSKTSMSQRCLDQRSTLLTCWLVCYVCIDTVCFSQDAIKKTSKDELPDFYNIQLERPKDDTKGYDVLFIDAASKVCQPYFKLLQITQGVCNNLGHN